MSSICEQYLKFEFPRQDIDQMMEWVSEYPDEIYISKDDDGSIIGDEMLMNFIQSKLMSCDEEDEEEEEEENKCCVCAKTLSETDVCQYEFDGKYETYCDGCREENLTTYCVSSKDYKEWWDENYEYDEGDEDECIMLCVKRIDNSNDAKCEYSIEWGGDESGKMNGINTSSYFAAMCCGWQCDDY